MVEQKQVVPQPEVREQSDGDDGFGTFDENEPDGSADEDQDDDGWSSEFAIPAQTAEDKTNEEKVAEEFADDWTGFDEEEKKDSL